MKEELEKYDKLGYLVYYEPHMDGFIAQIKKSSGGKGLVISTSNIYYAGRNTYLLHKTRELAIEAGLAYLRNKFNE